MTRLPDPASGPGKDARLVQDMFDRVAPRYDLANTLLSLGQDAHWRRVTAGAIDPRPGEVMLDVAAGTGGLAHELGATDDQVRVIALDFSANMLTTGARRHAGQRIGWVNGDGLRLPLADASVDAVTIGFGLRNLPDPEAGLAEFARVTRPGGRLAVLEFSRPTWAPLRAVYQRYLAAAMPLGARLFTSDPAAYCYLADSILAWPDQRTLARLISSRGWLRPRWKNLTGGIVALHYATRA